MAANDLFYFTLFDQPDYLDWYNNLHDGTTLHTLPDNSQFKCYDSMKINNQLQPATYDGEKTSPARWARPNFRKTAGCKRIYEWRSIFNEWDELHHLRGESDV